MGNPLFRCCGPDQTLSDSANTAAFNKVELAATELFSVKVFTAYHTSVLVNGEEFFFSDSGIFTDRQLNSHQQKPSERIPLGYSEKTGSQLLQALRPHFRPGTYDLVRKNCNSFSDSAVFFLLGTRLERRFTALERLGQANTDMLSQVTKGMYMPNAAAENFSVETVLSALDKFETDREEDESSKTMKSHAAIMPGVQVTIVGLTSAASLNGQGASVVRYNPLNGRWEACLHLSGEVKAFRAENLRPAGELVLEQGDRVVVHGLRSDAGQSLNGQEGEVSRYIHETSRYEVLLGEESKALKAENLQKVTA